MSSEARSPCKAGDSAGNRGRAAGNLWARLDRAYVGHAAAVPLVNPYWFDFVSARVHNYQADPTLGLIADQVSLR